MKRVLDLGVVLSMALIIIPSSQVDAAGDDTMRILTYPTGLVVGDLDVKVDLGAKVLPAELYVDGASACTVTAKKPGCTVDLGPDPHIHHLELRRSDGSRADRWINRPGQEAELELLVGSPDERSVCEARIAWAHPLKQDPAELVVTMDGRPLRIAEDGHLARFPCPPNQQPVLVASAVFADGRRVETATVVGTFAERTSVELAAVPLMIDEPINPEDSPSGDSLACQSVNESWLQEIGDGARLETEPGFEVVLVLDPGASYQTLYKSGWHLGRLPTLDVTAKAGEEIFRKGHRTDEPKPKTSWRKAEATLFDADRLWYVAPDTGLHRVNGFAAGRPSWFGLLFKFGLAEIKETPRIADAVAASGLVAGAGPRRAVVLILGNNVDKRDGSQFTPRQAREYLSEVGVPLIVLRNGKARDDGWPKGLATLNMDAMADNLKIVQDLVERQCLAWIPAERLASLLVEGMPEGVRLAGRDGEAPESPAVLWAQAEVEADKAEAFLAEQQAVLKAALSERVDVTAVTVLVSAAGQEGRPLANLAVGDLETLEDGNPATALSLTSLAALVRPIAEPPAAETTKEETPAEEPAPPEEAPELPVAVYVDRVLGGGGDQRGALHAVKDQAARLVMLGPVEVVVRESSGVKSVLEPTRDAALLTDAIDQQLSDSQPLHAIESIRRDFANRIAPIPDRLTGMQVEAANEEAQVGVQTEPGAGVWFGAQAAASEEAVLLARAMRQLRLWASGRAEHRAGLLLVVGTSFDEDMGRYYQPFVDRHETHNASNARAGLRERRQTMKVDRLGQALAGTGWRVLTVAGTISGTTDYAAENRSTRFQEHMGASSSGATTLQTSDRLLIDAIGTQRHMAEASGGDAVLGAKGLRRALDAASGWYLLTYQVARPPDSTMHDLEIRSTRPGVILTTSRVVTDTTPEGQAEARALRLLAQAPTGEVAGAVDRGELQVSLAVGSPMANETELLRSDVEITVDLMPLVETLGQIGATPELLVSVATALPKSEPSVVHHQELLDENRAGWIYTVPVEWPAATGGQLAVTVKELVSGLWGGSAVDLPAEK